MKHIFKFFALLLLVVSCQKEEIEILDLSVSMEDIKRIELHSDASTLIPNGVAKMRFYPVVYAERSFPKYSVVDGVYVTDTVTMEYAVPNDQLKGINFQILDNAGNEVGSEGFSTTTLAPGSVVEFYAKAGNILSPRIPITIRKVPVEPKEELIIPVIFQLIVPPAATGEKYEMTSEHLTKVLNRVNDIFNRRATTDPNGGNARVTFKLAEYDQKGVKLTEPGINRISVTQANLEEMKIYGGTTVVNGYNRYIVKNKDKFIWDPNKYLNIWVLKISSSMSETGSSSYKYLAPSYAHSSFPADSIPGFKLKPKDSFTLDDIKFDPIKYTNSTNCLEVGLIVNYTPLINPTVQGGNAFNLASALGFYYGLLDTRKSNNTYPTADTDYCDDTNIYPFVKETTAGQTINASIFKNDSAFTGRPEGVAVKYFTSFNVMDVYTYGNSVTADQASRMRMVFEQCPTRWAYKSSFAFTGK